MEEQKYRTLSLQSLLWRQTRCKNLVRVSTNHILSNLFLLIRSNKTGCNSYMLVGHYFVYTKQPTYAFSLTSPSSKKTIKKGQISNDSECQISKCALSVAGRGCAKVSATASCNIGSDLGDAEEWYGEDKML